MLVVGSDEVVDVRTVAGYMLANNLNRLQVE